MASESSSAEEAYLALSVAFEGKETMPAKSLSMEDVKAYLKEHIATLLTRNPDKLLSILYRIDVLEKHVLHAFETAPSDQLAGTLADLVIERQLQKLFYRRKYSG